MAERIIVCGLNGSGKSTLGRRLAEALSCPFFDNENYYFPHRKQGEYYGEPRTYDEVCAALLKDLKENERCVFASVTGKYGKEAEELFTLAVYLEAPKDIRMERVRKRSFEKFGEEMLIGGKYFEEEEEFFKTVAARPEDHTEKWLSGLNIPVLRLDGTLHVEENIRIILKNMKKPF